MKIKHILYILLIIGLIRLVDYIAYRISHQDDIRLIYQPQPFFISNNNLGWKIDSKIFKFYNDKHKLIWTAKIDSLGNRNISNYNNIDPYIYIWMFIHFWTKYIRYK